MKITLMTVLCGAALLMTGCATSPPEVTTWDYKVIEGYVSSGIEAQLKQLGQAGWVVVSSAAPGESSGKIVVILKRPKP